MAKITIEVELKTDKLLKLIEDTKESTKAEVINIIQLNIDASKNISETCFMHLSYSDVAIMLESIKKKIIDL